MSRDKNAPVEPARPHTKLVAAEKFLYSPRQSNGSRDFALESKLSELEGTLATIWPDIATGEIAFSEAAQKILALFLATMFLRNPARRQTIAETHRRIVDQVQRDLRQCDTIPAFLDYEINGEPCRLWVDDFEENRNATKDDYQHIFVDLIQATAVPLATILLKKRWSFIVSDAPVFVTSDHPIVLRKTGCRAESVGFEMPGMSVKFPVSPHVLLHLDDGEGVRVCPLAPSPIVPREPWVPFNYDIWVSAERFMFCPRDPFDVLEEIMGFCDYARALERAEIE